MNTMVEKMKNFIEEQSENPWDTATFKDIFNLTNDARGKFGELVISNLIHYLNWDIQIDVSDESVRLDGHYDIKALDKRIEVKTACRGSKTNVWQHEPLYDNTTYDACDIIIFLDFDYHDYYVTICKSEDLPLGGRSNVKMFGNKHGTLRKNKDNGYKFDFSRTTINTALKAGICKQFNANDSFEIVAQWLNKCFMEN